jgi:hypothetical protein
MERSTFTVDRRRPRIGTIAPLELNLDRYNL